MATQAGRLRPRHMTSLFERVPAVCTSPAVSMAVLKVNSDNGLDLIDQFVPFVAECLRAQTSPIVSLPQLKSAMETTFGIRMPQGALKTVLGRAADRGLVRRLNRTYEPTMRSSPNAT